jgi:hypothetical protein
MFTMDSPSAPAAGGTDVQIDGTIMGQLFGPEGLGGNARVRHTIEPGVSLEVDGGVFHVTNHAEAGQTFDRNAYTGRLGAVMHSPNRRWAIGAGLGGGLSDTAGNWGAADVHGMVSGVHELIRPMLGVGLGYSAPFGDQTFMVHHTDEDGISGDVTLQLPRNALVQVSVGLELGPRDRAVIIGASMLRFWLFEDSVLSGPGAAEQLRDDAYLALGIGLRLGIN